MTDARTLAAALQRRAREQGFALAGITSVGASEHMEFYRRWIEAGRHGEMRWRDWKGSTNGVGQHQSHG